MTTTPMPRHFSAVSPDEIGPDAFLPIEKAGGLYVARLATPLVVQTPPMVLVSALDDEHGTPLSRAHVEPTPAFEAFARDVEKRVLDAALVNKQAWFRRPLEDQSLRASLKRFCTEGVALQVRVPADVELFDAEGAPIARDHADVQPGARQLRLILRLSEVCFGKNEFGALWTLVQARACPPKKTPLCLIDPHADEPEPDTAPIENEFF